MIGMILSFFLMAVELSGRAHCSFPLRIITHILLRASWTLDWVRLWKSSQSL